MGEPVSKRRVFTPTILKVRVSTLLALYGWRLRRHKVQELLAGIGIAIGVALFFGVLVANTSTTSSESQLIHAVIGSARLQLAARSPAGFDERLTQRVRELPGVEVAAPVLREDAVIVGPRRRQTIQLIGVTPTLAGLGGPSAKDASVAEGLLSGGIGLPSSVAGSIGAEINDNVTILADGEAHIAKVRGVLGSQAIGPIASSPVAVALLGEVQRLTDLPGRVTEVFLRPRPGSESAVASRASCSCGRTAGCRTGR